MNNLKRTIIIVYCLALIAACTYVPWEANSFDGKATIPAGYSFIWDAPIYFYFTPADAKTIGKPSLDAKTGSIYDNFMAQQNKSEMDKMLDQIKPVRLVVKAVDIKRLAAEIIALTAAAGGIYLVAGIKRDIPSKS